MYDDILHRFINILLILLALIVLVFIGLVIWVYSYPNVLTIHD
jgi:hypothetical protein